MSAMMSCYIGDLDSSLTTILTTHVQRGLLRLEGFILRLQPDAVSALSRTD
jgi:SWI/SNF-related matrix-associated actin-dependent regulator of chromatin subfamily A3